MISAQKANTGNAFSRPGLALSTANLFSAVSPGGTLYGLQHSNPVDTKVAYRGNATNYGAANDPMEGGKIGGINVFGGGFALYNSQGQLVGGLGSERRLLLRRSQYRLEDTAFPAARLRASGRERGSRSTRQHRVRHHPAGGATGGDKPERLGPSNVQHGCDRYRSHPSGDSQTLRVIQRRKFMNDA